MDDGAALAQVGGQVSIEALQRWQRATNYLAAAQIYLRDNCLLEEPLRPEHVKERLLGHWGAAPGINLVHAHLNRLVIEHGTSVLLVTGPGHGAVANLANLYLDGSLAELDPAYSLDRAGLFRFVRRSPAAFPSVPGTIHDGGALGYALATAFGAALDNPDLLVACIVGDGEAETGATAAAWHGTKFLDPATSGAVLPILNLNGYKASSPAVYSTMSDRELGELFTGFGWEVLLVAEPDVDAKLANAVDVAYQRIRALRESPRATAPRWPLIVLRTSKGVSAPERVDGHPLAGSFRAHGVPADDLRTNPRHLEVVEGWLRSYRPDELWDGDGRPVGLDEACPSGDSRIALNPHARGGRVRVPLDLPPLGEHALPLAARGEPAASASEHAAPYLRDVLVRSEPARNFRIVSPDALTGSALGAVLQATGRAYLWPVGYDDVTVRPDGRVLELLSGQVCRGWLQGYLQTGRHGLFVGSGAFAEVVGATAARYGDWLERQREGTPSFTYLLDRVPDVLPESPRLRLLLPPDANTLVATLARCLASTDTVNVVVAAADPLPQWLSMDEAVAHCAAGASAWEWAGAGDPADPRVVLAAAGATATAEALAAADLVRAGLAQASFRVVNVTDLMALAALPDEAFCRLFTRDRPVLVVLDGPASLLHDLLWARPGHERFDARRASGPEIAEWLRSSS